MADRFRDQERRDQELIRRSRLYGAPTNWWCAVSVHEGCCGVVLVNRPWSELEADPEGPLVARLRCECACHGVTK